MTDPTTAPLKPELVQSNELECSLGEVCVSCRVEESFVAALVEHGAIDVSGTAPASWRFARASLLRVARARRLERDLELNLAGIALALDLIDEIEDLRRRLAATGSG